MWIFFSESTANNGGKFTSNVCDTLKAAFTGIFDLIGNLGAEGLSELGLPTGAWLGAFHAFRAFGNLAGNWGKIAGGAIGHFKKAKLGFLGKGAEAASGAAGNLSINLYGLLFELIQVTLNI